MNLKIELTGCSGIGKTTMAKAIAAEFGIPFISGSYSDLVPETKHQPHKDMVGQDEKTIYLQDWQVINMRHQQHVNNPAFVTDRSYVDSMAYQINKLSHRYPECDVREFISACIKNIHRDTDMVIFFPFSVKALIEWDMEDNKKRILNRYYQFEISSIIDYCLDLLGASYEFVDSAKTFKLGKLNVNGKEIPLLVVDELNYAKRERLVIDFIRGQLKKRANE